MNKIEQQIAWLRQLNVIPREPEEIREAVNIRPEIADTLQALYEVAKAAEIVMRDLDLLNLSKSCPDLREALDNLRKLNDDT